MYSALHNVDEVLSSHSSILVPSAKKNSSLLIGPVAAMAAFSANAAAILFTKLSRRTAAPALAAAASAPRLPPSAVPAAVCVSKRAAAGTTLHGILTLQLPHIGR